ncbi:hypothetical protein [Sphingomonas arenae]|uniref:hypothetical protein n=1 Tax=Sphingomonas arenae TaxID=2812555 RepID=UPI001967FCBC|nr:hypothetical protein [Sphingomonas arenae]
MADAPKLTEQEIARDARWLVQACDPLAGLVRFVDMSPEDYRAASFLDDRLLQNVNSAHLVPLEVALCATQRVARDDVRWIFHIGHVGSTLIARLLGELDNVLSIREPRALRDLALLGREHWQALIDPVRKLYSRTFAPEEKALVKTTSFVSDLAAEWIGPKGRGLFLTVSPTSYIQTMLAGENSRRELSTLVPFRAQRMSERVPFQQVSPGDHPATLAAAAWACEMTALEQAAERLGGDQLMWTNFDVFLDQPETALRHIAGFLGFPASDQQLASVTTGPLMRRYSKALEYDYTPALRRKLLQEAAARYRTEIDQAMTWLDRAAATSPLLRRAIERSAA